MTCAHPSGIHLFSVPVAVSDHLRCKNCEATAARIDVLRKPPPHPYTEQT
jgi:hypothetical protein